MEDKIQDGEYIITDEGIIDKVIYSNIECIKGLADRGNIKKHSYNIFDLLKEEDIVELEYYVRKYASRITRKFEIDKYGDRLQFENAHCTFRYNLKDKKWENGKGYNIKIKTILTKEQYEKNCFIED